jgi:hypothetical protein
LQHFALSGSVLLALRSFLSSTRANVRIEFDLIIVFSDVLLLRFRASRQSATLFNRVPAAARAVVDELKSLSAFALGTN